jgi:hypothetical protein
LGLGVRKDETATDLKTADIYVASLRSSRRSGGAAK